jgi:hypothetical protein
MKIRVVVVVLFCADVKRDERAVMMRGALIPCSCFSKAPNEQDG